VTLSHPRPRALLVLPLLTLPFFEHAKNRFANFKSVIVLTKR
jgi:hypothetical protein